MMWINVVVAVSIVLSLWGPGTMALAATEIQDQGKPRLGPSTAINNK